MTVKVRLTMLPLEDNALAVYPIPVGLECPAEVFVRIMGTGKKGGTHAPYQPHGDG
jgi:hypothetical protein